jgi:hypothetical protein
MGGALGASASLGEAGVVCLVCPRAELAKTVKTKAVPIRMIRTPARRFFAAFRGRPQPVHKNEPRPTPGLRSVICYLTLALDFDLSAAAAVAEGSAKAITASPSSKLWPGSPPKPYATYSTPLTS